MVWPGTSMTHKDSDVFQDVLSQWDDSSWTGRTSWPLPHQGGFTTGAGGHQGTFRLSVLAGMVLAGTSQQSRVGLLPPQGDMSPVYSRWRSLYERLKPYEETSWPETCVTPYQGSTLPRTLLRSSVVSSPPTGPSSDVKVSVSRFHCKIFHWSMFVRYFQLGSLVGRSCLTKIIVDTSLLVDPDPPGVLQ